jgi:hypothetical protein
MRKKMLSSENKAAGICSSFECRAIHQCRKECLTNLATASTKRVRGAGEVHLEEEMEVVGDLRGREGAPERGLEVPDGRGGGER